MKKLEIKSAIAERMKQLESSKVATAIEVLQILTSVLRQELTEEVVTLNPVTGEYVTVQKKPSIAEVIKAAGELLKRFVVWFSKTLQNWKALVSTSQIQSDEKCGDYAEVTYNGDKAETYVDVYAKVSNRAIKD